MMSLSEIANLVVNYLQTHTLVAVAILAAVLIVGYFKPKPLFKLVAFLLFVVAVYYVLSLFSESLQHGSKQKTGMSRKTLDIIEEGR